MGNFKFEPCQATNSGFQASVKKYEKTNQPTKTGIENQKEGY